jgi:hypothetical protein
LLKTIGSILAIGLLADLVGSAVGFVLMTVLIPAPDLHWIWVACGFAGVLLPVVWLAVGVFWWLAPWFPPTRAGRVGFVAAGATAGWFVARWLWTSEGLPTQGGWGSMLPLLEIPSAMAGAVATVGIVRARANRNRTKSNDA